MNEVILSIVDGSEFNEYKKDYAERLMTEDKIYDTMVGDIYGQGKVLALSKYKYLKWSYNCFLGGMASAMAVFALQGAAADFILEYGLWLKDIIFEEISFTFDTLYRTPGISPIAPP